MAPRLRRDGAYTLDAYSRRFCSLGLCSPVVAASPFYTASSRENTRGQPADRAARRKRCIIICSSGASPARSRTRGAHRPVAREGVGARASTVRQSTDGRYPTNIVQFKTDASPGARVSPSSGPLRLKRCVADGHAPTAAKDASARALAAAADAFASVPALLP